MLWSSLMSNEANVLDFNFLTVLPSQLILNPGKGEDSVKTYHVEPETQMPCRYGGELLKSCFEREPCVGTRVGWQHPVATLWGFVAVFCYATFSPSCSEPVSQQGKGILKLSHCTQSTSLIMSSPCSGPPQTLSDCTADWDSSQILCLPLFIPSPPTAPYLHPSQVSPNNVLWF